MKLDDSEQYHLSFEYKKFKLPRSTISVYGSWNDVSFYDLFGPTKSSRKGVVGGVGYEYSFLNSTIRKLELNSDLSGFYGLEKSPDFQTIDATGFDNNLFVNFSNRFSYSNLSFSMGAVDYEKGISSTMSINSAYTAGKMYPNINGSLSLGTLLPIKHVSVWLRTFAGHSFSSALNPFTRFGFASFGNNYIDYRASKQYRNMFSHAGLKYGARETIISQSFVKSMAELSLPAVRFRKFGFFNFFVNWVHPTVFTSMVVSEGDSGRQTFANLGAQIDMRMVVLSQQSSTMSFGYAKAKNVDSGRTFNEWTISLKLLK